MKNPLNNDKIQKNPLKYRKTPLFSYHFVTTFRNLFMKNGIFVTF